MYQSVSIHNCHMQRFRSCNQHTLALEWRVENGRVKLPNHFLSRRWWMLVARCRSSCVWGDTNWYYTCYQVSSSCPSTTDNQQETIYQTTSLMSKCLKTRWASTGRYIYTTYSAPEGFCSGWSQTVNDQLRPQSFTVKCLKSRWASTGRYILLYV